MDCPKCGNAGPGATKIYKTEQWEEDKKPFLTVERYRECVDCGYCFKTHEDGDVTVNRHSKTSPTNPPPP